MFHVAQRFDKGVVKGDDGLGAPMEINVESARLVEARVGNVKEALIGQVRVFGVVWRLINGIECARVLVVFVFGHLFTVEMLEDF